MRHYHIDKDQDKGWYFGPWNSPAPAAVGYANQGIDEAHYHEQMFEIYLVAQGWSTILLDGDEYTLRQGDALLVEPGEVHTFVASSEDYLHFVVHAPFVAGDKVSVKRLTEK